MNEISSSNPKFPRCPECGGKVRLTAKAGRARELIRGIYLPIPDDFCIPTCARCGEESMAPEIATALDELLNHALIRRIEGYLSKIKHNFGVTQMQIEDACRVTRSYLSHVLAGRNLPSGTLVEQLALFAEIPGAFEHAYPEATRKKTTGEQLVTTVRLARFRSKLLVDYRYSSRDFDGAGLRGVQAASLHYAAATTTFEVREPRFESLIPVGHA